MGAAKHIHVPVSASKSLINRLPLLLALLFAVLTFPIHAVQAQGSEPEAVPGEFIVKFDDAAVADLRSESPELAGYTIEELKVAMADLLGARDSETVPLVEAEKVELPPGAPLEIEVAVDLLDSEMVEYIEPNYIYRASAVPNDPGYSALWGMHQSNDIDIDAPEAWDITTGGGSNPIVVGVVDTGIDYNHVDLQANMWKNDAELNGVAGVDDDSNGVIDDVYGFNAVSDNGNPMDDQTNTFHGTHCAGTIGAVGNNGVGVVGVAWNVKLMALKFLSSTGSGSTTDAIEAINYAVTMRNRGVNLRVLSNSWGGGAYSNALESAIQAANQSGMIFIAAAGNNSTNNDVTPQYPANYNVANVVSVAAVDSAGSLASFSCYGATTVDLAAPGVQIYSTKKGNAYQYLSGTSMATPHVSGVAALAFTRFPQYTPSELKDTLMSTVTPLSNLNGKMVSPGIVNLPGSIANPSNPPPVLNAIADVAISPRVRTRTVPIVASDPNGDPLTYQTRVVFSADDQAAATLDTTYNFNARLAQYDNLYGGGERWIGSASGSYFLIFPNLNMFELTGGSAYYRAIVARKFYDNPSLLVTAAPLVDSRYATLTLGNSNQSLDIAVTAGVTESFRVEVSVSDGTRSDKKSFQVSLVDLPPVVDTIPDQNVHHSLSTLTVQIPVTDPSNDPLTITPTVSTIPQLAYSLDQYWDLSPGNASYYYNYRGHQEKYYYSASKGKYLIILPDGTLALWEERWTNLTVLAKFPTDYYANPAKLVNVARPDMTVPATASVSNKTLTLNLTNGFVGTFYVGLSVTDGTSTVLSTFLVTRVNTAPTLAGVANRSVGRSTSSVAVTLAGADADNDTLTYSANVYSLAQLAYALDQQYDFAREKANDYLNMRGHQEKYLYAAKIAAYVILLPDGTLALWENRWDNLTVLAVLPTDYYANPLKLVNLTAPAASTTATASLASNTLTLAIDSAFNGTFYVKAAVTDGVASASTTFSVTRSNNAPVLPAFADVSLSRSTNSKSLSIGATDADGDSLTYTVNVFTLPGLVYSLDQQYDFSAPNSTYYYNYRGQREKYLYSASKGQYFIIMPDGRFALWEERFTNLTVLGLLPVDYYTSPAKLINVAAPAVSTPATASVSGTTLTLDLTSGFFGSFFVSVKASDGSLSDSKTFTVSRNNTAPTFSAITDKSTATTSLSVPFTVSDADNDSVTVTATAMSGAGMAYQLDQQYDFIANQNSFYVNYRGRAEKYVYSTKNQYFYVIMPDGSFLRWEGAFNTSVKIATLPILYYNNPQRLINVPSAPAATLTASVSGNTVTVTRDPSLVDKVTVTLTGTDGSASASTAFAIDFTSTNGGSNVAADADGDGVSNDEETSAGSDPFDAGSFTTSLRSPLHVLWNGFLEMVNILELVNPNDEAKEVTVSLYSIDGTLAHRRVLALGPRSQFDLILNDVPGFTANSYGIVKLEFDGVIDGRVFYYRSKPNSSEYEFAFGIPFTNPARGRSVVGLNTFDPSNKGNEVANWLTFVNLSTEVQSFHVTTVDQNGAVLAVRDVTVPPFGRTDEDGGHGVAGHSKVGAHIIEPANIEEPYIAQLTRYGSNSPAGVAPTGYDFAFPLIARAGTRRPVLVPISRQFNEDNWLEILNTEATELSVKVELVNDLGAVVSTAIEVLAPYAQKHLYATAVLAQGKPGLARITSLSDGAVIAQSMFYFRNSASGRIEAMYGSQAAEALSRVIFGSYNLYLGMHNWLRLFNGSPTPSQVQLIVNTAHGEVPFILEVAPYQTITLPLHDYNRFGTAANTYGSVELRSTVGSTVAAELVRIRPLPGGVDFAAPTVVR